jgi:hypothetical protein
LMIHIICWLEFAESWTPYCDRSHSNSIMWLNLPLDKLESTRILFWCWVRWPDTLWIKRSSSLEILSHISIKPRFLSFRFSNHSDQTAISIVYDFLIIPIKPPSLSNPFAHHSYQTRIPVVPLS